MKIRNKILTILITLIFLLSFNLTSCTGQLNDSSSANSSQQAATTKASATSTQITTTTTIKSSEQATTTSTSKQATTTTIAKATTTTEEKNSNSNSNPASGSSKLTVHFIDVGQGDSALIQTPNGLNILIDGGPKSSSDKVVSYLKSLGIEKLNIVISTHPHEDHIGGLISVINSFDIDNVIDSGVSHTSATFKNYLNAIKAKNINYLTPSPGESFDLEANIKLIIYGPYSRSSNDLNNSSVVSKLTYGSTSFLFVGDAESREEKQLVSGKLDLSADVLKVGHE